MKQLINVQKTKSHNKPSKKSGARKILTAIFLIGFLLSSSGCTSLVESYAGPILLNSPITSPETTVEKPMNDELQDETPIVVEVVEETTQEVPVEVIQAEVKEEVQPTPTPKPEPKPEPKPTPETKPAPAPTPVAPKPVAPTPRPAPVEECDETAPAPTQPEPEQVATETKPVAQEISDTPAATWELEVLRLTNIERQKVGQKPLTYIKELEEGAKIRSLEVMDYWSHTRPDGTRFFTVFGDLTYRSIGENLAAGHRTPKQAVDAWMTSEGHRNNMLNEKYDQMAVGISQNAEGRFYWVQIFYKAR